MTIIADPVFVSKLVNFTATIVPPTSGAEVERYEVTFWKNGTQVMGQNPYPSVFTVLPDGAAPVRPISVVNTDVICVRVVAINSGGKSAVVEECIVVDFLPELPANPEVIVTTS
jgi:hypothetical protein